jgi:glutathione S-transferase
LTLEEKGVSYDLINVDVFAPGGPAAEYLKIHPFGRIPSFEHAGFRMYETGSIARYIDEAFDGPALQPQDVCARARMSQIIAVLDSYAYRPLVWDIYVERMKALRADEQRIASALPRARTCLEALADLMEDREWLAGSSLSLADLHAAPMFAYFLRTEEGQTLMARIPTMMRWWAHMAERPSMLATEPV